MPGLTPVRRAVGVAVVLLLLACAVAFYQLAPGHPTSGPSPSTAANPSTSPAPTRVAPESATPKGASSSSGLAIAIQLQDSAVAAKPFQAVRIEGTYHGGGDRFLWVERWEGGRWVTFPIPTKTDQSGRFTAYVELGRPGRYRLRVIDPDSGVKSEPFVLLIKR